MTIHLHLETGRTAAKLLCLAIYGNLRTKALTQTFSGKYTNMLRPISVEPKDVTCVSPKSWLLPQQSPLPSLTRDQSWYPAVDMLPNLDVTKFPNFRCKPQVTTITGLLHNNTATDLLTSTRTQQPTLTTTYTPECYT